MNNYSIFNQSNNCSSVVTGRVCKSKCDKTKPPQFPYTFMDCSDDNSNVYVSECDDNCESSNPLDTYKTIFDSLPMLISSSIFSDDERQFIQRIVDEFAKFRLIQFVDSNSDPHTIQLNNIKDVLLMINTVTINPKLQDAIVYLQSSFLNLGDAPITAINQANVATFAVVLTFFGFIYYKRNSDNERGGIDFLLTHDYIRYINYGTTNTINPEIVKKIISRIAIGSGNFEDNTLVFTDTCTAIVNGGVMRLDRHSSRFVDVPQNVKSVGKGIYLTKHKRQNPSESFEINGPSNFFTRKTTTLLSTDARQWMSADIFMQFGQLDDSLWNLTLPPEYLSREDRVRRRNFIANNREKVQQIINSDDVNLDDCNTDIEAIRKFNTELFSNVDCPEVFVDECNRVFRVREFRRPTNLISFIMSMTSMMYKMNNKINTIAEVSNKCSKC